MEGGEILAAFSADQSDGPQDLGTILFRGETAIGILDIMSRDNDVLGNFKKIFIIPARWTRDQIDRRTIFNRHGVFIGQDGGGVYSGRRLSFCK